MDIDYVIYRGKSGDMKLVYYVEGDEDMFVVCRFPAEKFALAAQEHSGRELVEYLCANSAQEYVLKGTHDFDNLLGKLGDHFGLTTD